MSDAQVRVDLLFNPEMDAGKLQSGVNIIKKSLKDVTFGDKIDKEFKNLFGDFEKAMGRLQSSGKLDFSKSTNVKKYIEDLQLVLKVASDIEKKSNKLDFSKVMPSSSLPAKRTFDELRSSLEMYEAAITDLEIAWKSASGELKRSLKIDIKTADLKELATDSQQASQFVQRLKDQLKAMMHSTSKGQWSSVAELGEHLEKAKTKVTELERELLGYEQALARGGLGAKEAEELARTINIGREVLSLTQTQAAELTKEFNRWSQSETHINKISNALKDAGHEAAAVAENLDMEQTERKLKQLEGALEELLKLLSKNMGEGVQELKTGVEETAEAAKKGEVALTDMTESARQIESVKRRMVDMFSMDKVINLFTRSVREAWNTVKELDQAMSEIAVVTDFSVPEVWGMRGKYVQEAKELGAATLDVVKASALYYQQGLSQAEVTEVTSETMKMARIASLDGAKATDLMTAALRGFNMEMSEAQRVNDVYSQLAAKSAANTLEIAEAMTRTASIANSAGMSFENTAAFLDQMIETTRESPENLGTAMKTIIARFQELKKAPEDIGEIDGEKVDANRIETALRSVGVALRDTNGEFRNLDEVFNDISAKWDSMTQLQQRYIATTAAGSRQQSRFIAMVSNHSRLTELQGYAYGSAGKSQEQFAKTLDTVRARINKLRTEFELFLTHIADASLMRGVMDFFTTILSSLNKLLDVMPAVAKVPFLGALSFGSAAVARKGMHKFFDLLLPKGPTAGPAVQAGATLAERFVSGYNTMIANSGPKVRDLDGFFRGIKTPGTKTANKIGQAWGKALGGGFKTTAIFALKTAGVVAAIAGLIALVNSIREQQKALSTEGRLETMATVAEAAEEAATSAKSAYDELLQGESAHNKRLEEINSLKKGTVEWQEAILEANSELLKLAETSPLLAERMKVGKDGLLNLTPQDWEDAQREQVELFQKAQMTGAIARASELQLEIELSLDKLQHEFKMADSTTNSAGNTQTTTRAASDSELQALLHTIDRANRLEGGFFAKGVGGKEYSDALMRVAEASGQSAEKIYELKDSYEAYTSALETNQKKIQLNIGTALSNLVDEDAPQALQDAVGRMTQGFAATYSDNVASMEDDLRKRIKQETGTMHTLWGKPNQALIDRFNSVSDITFDQLDDSIKNSIDKTLTAITEIEAGKAAVSKYEDIIKSMADKGQEVGIKGAEAYAEGIKAVSSLLTSDLDGISRGLQKELRKADNPLEVIEKYALQAGVSIEQIAEVLGVPVEQLGTTLKDKAVEQADLLENAATELPKAFDEIAEVMGESFKGLKEPLDNIIKDMNPAEIEKFAESFTKFALAFGPEKAGELVKSFEDLSKELPTDAFDTLLNQFNMIDASDPMAIAAFVDMIAEEDWGEHSDAVDHFLGLIGDIGPKLLEIDLESLRKEIIATNELMRKIDQGTQGRSFSESDYNLLVSADTSLADQFVYNLEGGFTYVGDNMSTLSEALKSNTNAILEDTKERLGRKLSGVESLFEVTGTDNSSIKDYLANLSGDNINEQRNALDEIRNKMSKEAFAELTGIHADYENLQNLSQETISRVIKNLITAGEGYVYDLDQMDAIDKQLVTLAMAQSNSQKEILEQIKTTQDEERALWFDALVASFSAETVGTEQFSQLLEAFNAGKYEEAEKIAAAMIATQEIADRFNQLQKYSYETINEEGERVVLDLDKLFAAANAAFDNSGIFNPEKWGDWETGAAGIAAALSSIGIEIENLEVLQDKGVLDALKAVMSGKGTEGDIQLVTEMLFQNNEEILRRMGLLQESSEAQSKDTEATKEATEATEADTEAKRRNAEENQPVADGLNSTAEAKKADAAAASEAAQANADLADSQSVVAGEAIPLADSFRQSTDAKEEDTEAAKDNVREYENTRNSLENLLGPLDQKVGKTREDLDATREANAATEEGISIQERLIDMMGSGKLDASVAAEWTQVADDAQDATTRIIEYVDDVAEAVQKLADTKLHLTGTADYSNIISALQGVIDKANEVTRAIRSLSNRRVTFRMSYQNASIPTSSGGSSIIRVPSVFSGFMAMQQPMGVPNYADAYGLPGITPTMQNAPIMMNSTPDMGLQMGFASSNIEPTAYGDAGGMNPSGGATGGVGVGSGANVTGMASQPVTTMATKSTKEEEPWKNTYDKIYNLVKTTAREGRTSSLLDKEYKRLIKDSKFTLEKILKNLVDQKDSLEKQYKYWEQQHKERRTDLARVIKEFSDVNHYASLTADGIVNIDWGAIDNVTDQEHGKRIEEYIKELEKIQQQFEEAKDKQDEIKDKLQEIVDQGKNEYLKLEQQIFDAIVKGRETQIQKLKDIDKTVGDSNKNLLSEIKNGVDEVRAQRNEAKQLESMAEKERRLTLLRMDTSGANELEIRSLEQQLADERQSYTDSLIDKAILNLQQGNDAAAEQRQLQIELMDAQLKTAQTNGEIWKETYAVLTAAFASKDIPGFLEGFLREIQGVDSMSNLQQTEWSQELREIIEGGFAWYIEQNKLSAKKDMIGRTITFKDSSGKEQKGKVGKDGTVTIGDKVYSGIIQAPDGSWITNQAAKAVQKPTPPPSPSPAPEKAISAGAKVKAGSSAPIFDWRDGKDPERQYYRNDPRYTVLQTHGNWVQVRHHSLSKGVTGWFRKGDLTAYERGGLIDFTGPAWVDGNKKNPEMVLSSTDTKNFITLKNVLADIMKGVKTTSKKDSPGHTYYNIDIFVDELADGYDTDQMMKDIRREIVTTAAYKNVNAVNLKR